MDGQKGKERFMYEVGIVTWFIGEKIDSIVYCIIIYKICTMQSRLFWVLLSIHGKNHCITLNIYYPRHRLNSSCSISTSQKYQEEAALAGTSFFFFSLKLHMASILLIQLSSPRPVIFDQLSCTNSNADAWSEILKKITGVCVCVCIKITQFLTKFQQK